MDDMILWDASREHLVEFHHRCREFAATRLALEFKSAEVQRTDGVFHSSVAESGLLTWG
jgi:hypothetical protein